MIEVRSLFDVKYGVNLELNAMIRDPNGLAFVSRSARNNGVVARVARLPDKEPIPAGTISVAGGGSVMASFLQPEPYYSGRDLYYLTSKVELSDARKLYYCGCLWANRYRFSYGRQANRTLGSLLVPDVSEIPAWVDKADIGMYQGREVPLIQSPPPELDTADWRPFSLGALFTIRKGNRLTSRNRTFGRTPYIGAVESNNGVTASIGQAAIHAGNTISVAYNGSVAEAFYQPTPFWATDDVNVLSPCFEMTPEIALFICTLIRLEKYRFNYGRKWRLERMQAAVIRLPVDKANQPAWREMTRYIQSLPFSSNLAPQQLQGASG